MEDWALIRRLAAEGVAKARIARRLGILRNTVAKAVACEGPPKYERKSRPTSLPPFEPHVRKLLAMTPEMPATVLAERVGWTGSIRWFRDNVNQVRADHSPIDPGDRGRGPVRSLVPPRKFPLEDGSRTLLPVLVMTCGYSRYTLGRMIPTRKTADLLLGTWDLLSELGRVPRRLIWNNEPSDLLSDGVLGVPVELFQGLPGSSDPQLDTGNVASDDLAVEHDGEVLLIGPAGIPNAVGQPSR